MKEFNLSEWLQDKSRKVVTRDGRLLKENKHNQHNDSIQESLDKASKCRLLYELKKFIDSLPEEPASENLEEEFHSWMIENCDDNGFFNQLELARHFAEWQKQQMKEVLQTEYEKGRFDMREEMMKALVDGEVMKNLNNQLCVKSEPIKDAFGDLKFGDKVKIIIVKTE